MPEPPLEVNDWTSEDPWLRESMRRDALLDRVEEGVLTALARAIREWFIQVRDAVLGTTAGAGSSNTPPDMDAWPEPDTWWNILRENLVTAMQTAYRAVMRDLAPSADKDLTLPSFVDHITTAWRDILTWPENTYQQARAELDQAREAGAGVREQRRTLDLLLRVNAPNQQRREEAAEYRRAGKAVPVEILRGDDGSAYAWHNQARVDARWLTVDTANVALLDGARQQQQATGEQLFKAWAATTDQRVRPSHWAAFRQAVPLEDPFTVGGWGMQYPGDTSAPPALWKNCRCTMWILNAEEADESNNRREQELPNRTDVHGQPVAADASGEDTTPMTTPAPDTSRSERIATSALEHPPASWFADPQLTGPTKVRVTDEGRVYGHIGAWGTTHAGRPDVSIDRFRNDPLARFHRHPVVTADGDRIKTGPLATGGHASTGNPLPTLTQVQAHYDDPRFTVADCAAGMDEHGIWIAGSVRPGVTPFQVMLLDRYSISGDWREDELLAACSVSVPGFHLDDDHGVVALSASAATDGQSVLADPTPRAVWSDDGSALVACVAAGIITSSTLDEDDEPAGEHNSSVDVDRIGWQVYRASQQAAAVDREVTTAARQALAPKLESAMARAAIGELDMLDDADYQAARRIARMPHRAGASRTRVQAAANWVDAEGGLPEAIGDVADALMREGMSESRAIATAVSRAKVWCSKGNAKYCAAIASWESMKRRANAD